MATNTRVLQVLNILSLTVVLIVNYLANTIPINGYTTGELSDLLPNLFVPAGITFSIWGIIYLSLITFIVYLSKNLFESQHRSQDYISLVGPWFIINCLANSTWIFAWHYRIIWLSMVLMLLILFSLVVIYQRLHHNPPANVAAKYTVHFPFSIYLGWITIATVANVTALLVFINWSGWGLPQVFWTALVIALATFIGLWILHRFNDIFYAAVIVWAFAGIILKRWQSPDEYPIIVTAALSGIGLLLYRAVKNRVSL